MINICKEPVFLDDSYLITIKDFEINGEKLQEILKEDEYTCMKMNKFTYKDTSTHFLNSLLDDRPSLRNIKKIKSLDGSIYTRTVEIRNDEMNYLIIIDKIKTMLEMYKGSRRVLLRFSNSIKEYYNSEVTNDIDVSCLSFIQYLQNNVKIVFRASDVKNELFTDIVTIYSFFIRPIYKREVDIEIYSSTTQNYEFFNKTIDDLNKKLY